jgi:hypothetical protein
LRKLAVIGVVGVAIGLIVLLMLRLFPSDETVIRRQLDKIAQLASFSAQESAIARMAVASRLCSFFRSELVIRLDNVNPEYGNIEGRDQLRQVLVAVRTQLNQLRVEFLDHKIHVEEDGLSATALLTALADVNRERNAIVHQLRIRLMKSDNQWLIAEIETLQALGR